jgi:ketosteroid isomerase-like protein
MTQGLERSVAKLFGAFNRRAVDEVIELCAEGIEFEAATAESAAHSGIYAGREGVREYFADLERVWDEVLITPRRIAVRDGEAIALGRVFARSRSAGLRDLPVAWRLRARAGRFDWIKVYEDRAEALRSWEGR